MLEFFKKYESGAGLIITRAASIVWLIIQL